MKYPILRTITWIAAIVILCQGSRSYGFAESVSIEVSNAVARRALPNAPNGYAPEGSACPSPEPVIRSGSTLSPDETSWLAKRRNQTQAAMIDLFSRINVKDFDAPGFLNNQAKNVSALPNIGIAVSGGGYRAMMNGAGAVAAYDSRTANSTGVGHLGGLLQATTYISGLSGGSWLLGSLYMNNFTTVPALLSDNTGTLWDLDYSVLEGPATISNYWRTLVNDITDKEDAGFNTSITDYWGRSLSYQFINTTDGGLSYTWSSIALQPEFIEGQMPLPLVIAVERTPDQLAIASNTPIYEFNPWELGTFDPRSYGFVPLMYLGSNFSAGKLQQNTLCVRGFDNAGFVMGTSSSLFNQGFLVLNGSNQSSILTEAITQIHEEIGEDNNDISLYSPNPFHQYNVETNPSAESTTLVLVDGGEDLQNIPFHPLLQSSREVDVIFAIDSSADVETRWPNGTSIVATYRRSLISTDNGTAAFPSIPDQSTFVNLGLNSKPTFFGCDSKNMTGVGPLIVYLPNSPYSYFSNVSTFDLEYNDTERDGIVQNGYNVATMANGTVDEEWQTCVGCAILSRSLERTGVAIPATCQHCFSTYCWNGTINDTFPGLYDPQLVETPQNATSSGGSNATTSGGIKSYGAANFLAVSFIFGVCAVQIWI